MGTTNPLGPGFRALYSGALVSNIGDGIHGIPAGLQRPAARSRQQRLTPNHLLGRVNVTTRIFTRGIIVFGALASGALATATSTRWTFVAGGSVQLAAAIVMWAVLARLQGVSRRPDAVPSPTRGA